MQDQEAQIARKKRRATTRTAARSIAGTSLEVGTHPISLSPLCSAKPSQDPLALTYI